MDERLASGMMERSSREICFQVKWNNCILDLFTDPINRGVASVSKWSGYTNITGPAKLYYSIGFIRPRLKCRTASTPMINLKNVRRIAIS